MKKVLLSILIPIILITTSLAQSPKAFRYQAVARDAAGITLANQQVGFRISILKDSPTGTNVYSETHSVTTNFYGLASFDIGSGSVVSGDFSTIDWGNGSYYIQIEMDASGGTSYELMGSSKLISVPYSLHASKAAYINGFNELQDSVYSLYIELDDDSAFLKGLIDQNALDIATETANRISADNILQSQIVNESYERIAADNALQDSIDAEEARRILADQQIIAEMDADSSFLKGLIDNNTTAINNINLELDADSAFLKGLIDQNTTDIANETAARIAADQALQDSINAEEARRMLADQQILAEMDTDSTFLKGLIDDNTTSINNINLELDADSAYFQAQIDTNAAHIAQLNVELDADSTFLKGLIDQNATDITNETAARVAADQALQDSIDLEEARRIAADQALLDSIVAERNARLAAGYLTTEIDGDTTNEIQVLSISNDTIFLSNGGHVKLPADNTVTLDEAYEGNGNGAGRKIVADNGAVLISGTDGIISTGAVNSGAILSISGAGTRMIWYPKKAAFRAGHVYGNQWDDGSIGQHSIAMGAGTKANGANSTALGLNTEASGDYSIAVGYSTEASGNYSTAMGNNTTASGSNSTAMGYNTNASGSFSTAMGNNTNASGYNSIAMGHITTASGYHSMAMGNNTTALGGFSMATGNETTASGSFSTTMGFKTTASGDYSTAMGRNTNASGDYSMAMGRNTNAGGYSSTAMGYQTSASGFNSTAMGYKTTVSGSYSTAMGNNTTASGFYSTAMGYQTNVSGSYSTAMGNNTTASGYYSTAMGAGTTASEYFSTAIGCNTTASGYYSTAMGFFTKAEGSSSLATGQFNVGGTDKLFEIGNGSNAGRSNALTVLSNGRIGIGTSSPDFPLHVTSYRTQSSHTYAYLKYHPIASLTGRWTASSNYSVVASYNMRASEFHAISDKRIKTNFKVNKGNENLELINKIEVTDYTHIDSIQKGGEVKKGFIAQQVEAVYPRAVSQSTAYIPDIYVRSEEVVYEPANNTLLISIAKEHGLEKGDKVKLYNDTQEFEQEVLEVVSAKSLRIAEVEGDYSQLFVFGKQVDDFRSIDYDQVFTAGIGAIQELSRQNEMLKQQIERLQKSNSDLQESNHTLQVSNQEILERILLIERKLSDQGNLPADHNSTVLLNPGIDNK